MNKLFYGDNLDVLRRLANGRVDLIYLDPPFNSDRERAGRFDLNAD